MSRTLWFALVIAAVLTVGDPVEAVAARAGNCVTGAEWQSLDTNRFGDETHSARRSVIERAWDVRIVGAPNEFWSPGNTDRFYSAAYNFCGSPNVKVAIVYRISSDAWQYAVKLTGVPS